MKTLASITAIFVSALLVSEGVVSGELGATQPTQTENAKYTLAAADVDTNENWVLLPKEAKASARQMRDFKSRSNEIGTKVDKMLQQRLEQKFALAETLVN